MRTEWSGSKWDGRDSGQDRRVSRRVRALGYAGVIRPDFLGRAAGFMRNFSRFGGNVARGSVVVVADQSKGIKPAQAGTGGNQLRQGDQD